MTQSKEFDFDLEVITSLNKPSTYGVFPVDCSGSTRVLAECEDFDFAKELVHRYNNFSHLLTMCQGNKVHLEQFRPLFRNGSPEHNEMLRIIDAISKLNEEVISEALKRKEVKENE